MGNGGLGFWPRAAPPPARGGPCSCSVPPAARAARPPGARPAAPPSRFGAIAPSALFGPINGAKRKGMRAALQSPDLPPATPRRASAAGGLAVAGAGGVRPGPSRAAVVCVGRLRRPPVARGRPPPAQVVGNKGPGLRGSAGRPPCGLWPFPRGGSLFSWPSGRPGGGGQPLALSGPAPALVNAGRGPPAARRPGWGRSARGPLWPGPGPPLRPRSSIAPGPQRGAGA